MGTFVNGVVLIYTQTFVEMVVSGKIFHKTTTFGIIQEDIPTQWL